MAKKTGNAKELYSIRVFGRIRAIQADDERVELRLRICGSVEFQGREYVYDEEVNVTSCKSNL